MSEPVQPLDELTVIELATGSAAALAGRMMAGYGARVSKIEPPAGDPMRHAGPFPEGSAGGDGTLETSAAFLYFHGGKSSVVLDLDVAPAALDPLLGAADILLVDRPAAERAQLGLDPDRLTASFPQLVTVSITPYGESGPQRDYLATDLTEAASGGQMSLMGEADREPLKAYGNQAEAQSSFHVFSAAMAAIYRRLRTGRGAYVELSVQELQASAMEGQGPAAFNGDPVVPGWSTRYGNHARTVWSQYRCRDGYAGIFVQPPNMPAFFTAIGRPDDLARLTDLEFMNGELRDVVTQWCAERTREEIFQVAIATGAPFSYVATPDDLLTSPTIEATGLWRDVQHPVAGEFRVPGPPFRSSASSFELTPAPLLGHPASEEAR
jgi:CoA:oxalate CoA-transferase